MNADERRNHRAVNAKMVAAALARAEPARSAYEAVCCPQCFQSAGGYHGERATVLGQLQRVGWVVCEGTAYCSRSCLERWNKSAARLAHDHAVEVASVLPAVSMEPPAQVATGDGVRGFEERVATATCARCGIVHRLQQRRIEGADWLPLSEPLLAHAGWILRGGRRFCSSTCALFAAEAVQPVVPVVELNDAAYQAARPQRGVGLVGREIADTGRPRRGGK